MVKTDNEKYVKRGADMFIEYNPEWKREVNHANKGKVGAPYQYSETLIMLTAALRVGIGVRYRQLEGIIGKMIGESNTPSFSHIRKRIGMLDVNINQNEMITVSNKKHSRILAVDATGLKQHNRGEWMSKKWKVKRGFVKMHAMVDTQTMKITAISITDESVGDITKFQSLLGQSVDADCASEMSYQSGEQEISSDMPRYKNLLVSGMPPLADTTSDCSDDGSEMPTIIYGDAAYGSRANIAACARAGVVPGILHTINVTPRSRGSGAAWGISVRDQLGGSTKATRLDLLSQEEKRENQVYWKAKIGYRRRWVVEGVFSIFKRVFGEHVLALKWENIVHEIQLKVSLYNRWRDESLARESKCNV